MADDLGGDESRDCPFCRVELSRIAFVDPLVIGLWDAFPVTPGHLLLVPKRHACGWAQLSDPERVALLSAIERGRGLISTDFGAAAFNVGFNDGAAAGQTIPHFHMHIIPRRDGDTHNPTGGVRNVIPGRGDYRGTESGLRPHQPPDTSSTTAPSMDEPLEQALICGGVENALLPQLLPLIDQAQEVDLVVAFALESGVRLLRPHLQDLLARGGRLRVLVGDYMDVTDPTALRHLLDLQGDAHLFVFEAATVSFHPKAWVFRISEDGGVAIVGSSNLSETALRTGIEWNYRVCAPARPEGWREVRTEFEALLASPHVRPLSHAWIDEYQARRHVTAPARRLVEVAAELPPPPPEPHEIQRRALEALQQTRAEGFTAGLVVLATGLGKTWLSAFDSNAADFRRVLFVAHREEILAQATETFRRVRPNARFGRYTGDQKDLDADVLFASIQTLGRVAHLRHFAADAFDYIVIDEFHHAAARTYRGLIDHFTPKFMLGLTATPERMDGGDLLGLCQENLVFRCDAFEAISRELLSPFRYFGVPDAVDYANIPWRGSRFDETALTEALATHERARNALEQYRAHGGERTLGFCASQLHADFMADYFVRNGVRAVAVHAGAHSAPRATSLERLAAGELEVVFAVDMFNEGVDVPSIDTVLMLRPTESTVIWMQQFGRGLRRSEGKARLNVIDYIGNHRIFLTKARALLQTGEGDRALAHAIESYRLGRAEFPPGCEVTYELEALDLMERLLRPTARGDALEAFYVDFRLRHGTRPTALEAYHAGFNPRVTGHEGWFGFIAHMDDMDDVEREVLRRHGAFLQAITRTAMTKSYKMLLLRALLQEAGMPGAADIQRLTERFIHLAARNPLFRADVTPALSDFAAVQRLLIQNPIDAWTGARGTPGAYFAFEGGSFGTTFSTQEHLAPALQKLVEEVIDWRLAEYLARDSGDQDKAEHLEAAEEGSSFEGPPGAELWREYLRETIPPLYGLPFSTGSWNQGFVVVGRRVFLLVTLDKDDLIADHRYEDRFLDPQRFAWQSQNRTTRASKHGRIISGAETGYTRHLFVRATKTRGGRATPFTYCGEVQFETWEGDAPISVIWRLSAPLPAHLHRVFEATG